MRVADYIFERLALEGVRRPFVVTGRGALFLDDAIAKRKDFEPVFVHHEQSASFAAIASSEVNDTIGCAVVSTGCASTNCITGVLSAWQDGIPAVFISGQNSLQETTRYTGHPLRTYGQQEADIVGLVEPITKYAVMITSPDQIVYELEKALYMAKEGRCGPVWLDVPLDIQNMRVEPDLVEKFIPPTKHTDSQEQNIDYIYNDLSNAKRPVVLVGSGAKHSKCTEQLITFIEQANLPLVFTSSGADIYGSNNDLSIGSFGSMGCSRAGAFAVQNADYVLVLGSRLSSMTTGVDYCKFARDAKVVVVDIDKHEHTKAGISIERIIESDLKCILEGLIGKKLPPASKEWVSKCLEWKDTFRTTHKTDNDEGKIDLYDLADALSSAMADNAVFVCDSGFADVILPTNIAFKLGQRCVHPVSQGAMGFALPAALGIEVTSKRPTIVVVGDGSIMMNLQELQSISDQKANIKIFVVNNNVYAIIRRRQKELFRRRTIGTDRSNGVNCPEFESVANTFGLTYRLIDSNEDLESKVNKVLNMDGPVLCEILGQENQQYVEVAYAKTQSKKFVRRPLEDQSPFLERETFIENMLIDPIDQ